MATMIAEKTRIVDDPKWARSRNNKAILKRVEILGRLDDRRKAALANRDREALVAIAWEYATLGKGCPDTCTQILAEAERL